jgi:hypothetical protein
MAAICKKIISCWGEPLLMIDSNPPQTSQEWFDFYLEQALKHFMELEQDELIEKYPANCVLLKLTGHMNILPNWGLTITAENVTASGLTLVVKQSGGIPAGTLTTGQPYFIQRAENNNWIPMEPLLEAWGWTTEAWVISMNDTARWDISWEWLFGKLQPGHYRIGKDIYLETVPGSREQAVYYVEFEIS